VSYDPLREIVQEETFGPVLVVQPAQAWEEAIRLCNGVRHGLAASVFTASGDKVRDFLQRVSAGILKVNESTAGAAIDAPFGGWKASGVGPPEHGTFDIDFFTRPQTVYRDKRIWESS
jgi:acyl-CoA reductase-like NAD-dependent aldehyde dehydrogenase